MAITEDVLRKMKDQLSRTTCGPWKALNRHTDGKEDWFLGFDVDGPIHAQEGMFARRADAEFIAAAPETVEALLDEVWRLRSTLGIIASKPKGALESDFWRMRITSGCVVVLGGEPVWEFHYRNERVNVWDFAREALEGKE